MDSVLADIRKYGFSLVTLLLTASALITTANPVADRAAASSVVTVLVLVLFLMDRYWWVLLREAVHRATELEKNPGMTVSTRLQRIALLSHNTFAATACTRSSSCSRVGSRWSRWPPPDRAGVCGR